jgi:D-sedoheptulose 7-phosphate isomerase
MAFLFKQYSNDVTNALKGISGDAVERMMAILRKAQAQNAMVYIVGNGGSAATASHLANDLLKMAKLRAVALPDLVPAMTAYGNDNGWENMFADMLKNMLLPSDVVVCISCSGCSPNVVKALELAKTIHLPQVRTVVLTGDAWESPLVQLMPDVAIHVPWADIRVQEDCHLIVCHAVAGALV